MLGEQPQCCCIYQFCAHLTSVSPTKTTTLSSASMALGFSALSPEPVLHKNDAWILLPTPPNWEFFHGKDDFLFTFESLIPSRKSSTY